MQRWHALDSRPNPVPKASVQRTASLLCPMRESLGCPRSGLDHDPQSSPDRCSRRAVDSRKVPPGEVVREGQLADAADQPELLPLLAGPRLEPALRTSVSAGE